MLLSFQPPGLKTGLNTRQNKELVASLSVTSVVVGDCIVSEQPVLKPSVNLTNPSSCFLLFLICQRFKVNSADLLETLESVSKTQTGSTCSTRQDWDWLYL